MRDVAVVAAVHHDDRFYVATSRALQATARAGGRLAWAYAWRAALTLSLLLVCARVEMMGRLIDDEVLAAFGIAPPHALLAIAAIAFAYLRRSAVSSSAIARPHKL